MEKKIFTIKQLVERHPFLTENSIRWLLYKNEPGLEECIVRCNTRRIYILEESFMDFLFEKSRKYKEIKGLQILKAESKCNETA